MGDKYREDQESSDEVYTEGFEGCRQADVIDICAKRAMRQVGETAGDSDKYYRKMMSRVLRRMTYKDFSVVILLDDDDSSNRMLKLTPSLRQRRKRFGENF